LNEVRRPVRAAADAIAAASAGVRIDQQLPVITGETAAGGESRRPICDLELIGDHPYAWRRLRDDEREFTIAHIRDVHPARSPG
jgi:hypothetical protein